MEKKIVVYKDGSYKPVDVSWEYENDPEWLTTIQLESQDFKSLREVLDTLQERIDNPNARHYVIDDLKTCWNKISEFITLNESPSQPSEQKPPEPLSVKGATAEEILEKHFRHDPANDWTPHILNAMQEYATIQRNESIKSVETLMKASKRALMDDPKSNYLTNRISILQEVLDLLENKPF